MARISAIVAMSTDRAIGKAGDLPWRLPADLKHFRTLTSGHPIIMGRKTFASLPNGVLPDRTNIVITRQVDFAAPGTTVVHSLADALAAAETSDPDEIFIIGGGEIFAESLPQTERVYLTLVDTIVPDANTWFPELPAAEWQLVSEESHAPDERNPLAFAFQVYER